VADALTAARGPPRDEFSIGSSTDAQPEVYGPMTPSTAGAFAKARAFLRQVAGVPPKTLATLEVSQDW
jgi:hypothetical protein